MLTEFSQKFTNSKKCTHHPSNTDKLPNNYHNNNHDKYWMYTQYYIGLLLNMWWWMNGALAFAHVQAKLGQASVLLSRSEALPKPCWRRIPIHASVKVGWARVPQTFKKIKYVFCHTWFGIHWLLSRDPYDNSTVKSLITPMLYIYNLGVIKLFTVLVSISPCGYQCPPLFNVIML